MIKQLIKAAILVAILNPLNNGVTPLTPINPLVSNTPNRKKIIPTIRLRDVPTAPKTGIIKMEQELEHQ